MRLGYYIIYAVKGIAGHFKEILRIVYNRAGKSIIGFLERENQHQ